MLFCIQVQYCRVDSTVVYHTGISAGTVLYTYSGQWRQHDYRMHPTTVHQNHCGRVIITYIALSGIVIQYIHTVPVFLHRDYRLHVQKVTV